MRKITVDDNWHFPKTRRTDFTREEMLDILDFYLQYKSMLEENNPQFNPHDFTMLLYMYKMLDVDYINNMTKIKEFLLSVMIIQLAIYYIFMIVTRLRVLYLAMVFIT